VGVQQTVVCPKHGTADTADLVFFTDVDEALLPNVGFPAYSGRPPSMSLPLDPVRLFPEPRLGHTRRNLQQLDHIGLADSERAVAIHHIGHPPSFPRDMHLHVVCDTRS